MRKEGLDQYIYVHNDQKLKKLVMKTASSLKPEDLLNELKKVSKGSIIEVMEVKLRNPTL